MRSIIKKFIPPIFIDLIKKYTTTETIQEKNVALWYANNATETLLFNCPYLNKESLVFDIGGYKGEWAKNIFCRYMPNIYIFEPVHTFSEHIKNSFIKNDKVHIFNFGLSDINTICDIQLSEDASSICTKKQNAILESIEIRKISDFILLNNIKKIDLMKINVEGSEYNIIKDLHNHDLLKNIHTLQIQFHDFVDSAPQKINECQQILSQHHTKTWGYDLVWEGWSQK